MNKIFGVIFMQCVCIVICIIQISSIVLLRISKQQPTAIHSDHVVGDLIHKLGTKENNTLHVCVIYANDSLSFHPSEYG